MCYLELPRVPINNRSINKILQSLRNTCTRQRTAYSKRKVTKLWEHFPRFNNSKRALCNKKVLFRPRLPIDAKEENVRNGLAWVLSLFLVWVPEFQNTVRFLKTPGPGPQVFLQGTSFPSESYATVEALPASLNKPTTCKRIAQVITKVNNDMTELHSRK